MITKKEAIDMVEKFLESENIKPNRHIFKIPVYNNWFKKITVSVIKAYWKIRNIHLYKEIELYIKPDKWQDSKVREVVMNEYIEDLGICWSVPFCSIQYYETKHTKYGSIGGGPIFVDKENGEMHQTGSAPIDWLENYKNHKKGINIGEWPIWKPMDKSKFMNK